MLSIGEIARSTGVSRRMLRHWEHEGLLAPAVIDAATGYRRYQVTQLGRIRAIAELRDQGFSLAEIRVLLNPTIEQGALETVLRGQARSLRQQITEASTRLVHVQQRLDALQQKAREITMNLSLQPLTALTLWGFSTSVLDETDIPPAVAQLRDRLHPVVEETGEDLILLFDGTQDDAIIVSAGIRDRPAALTLTEIVVPATDEGVSVSFETPPASVSDAWVVIDSELQKRKLTTHGIYRQIISSTGAITLQAGVNARA